MKSLLLQEDLHHFGGPVEGVGIRRRIRHVAVAKAGIVHRDDVERVGQRRNEVAVLMRRGREAVQQDELGVAGLAGLAVEDVEPLDLDSSRPHRGLGDLRHVVHLTSLRLVAVMLGYSAKTAAATDSAQARPHRCTSSPRRVRRVDQEQGALRLADKLAWMTIRRWHDHLVGPMVVSPPPRYPRRVRR